MTDVLNKSEPFSDMLEEDQHDKYIPALGAEYHYFDPSKGFCLSAYEASGRGDHAIGRYLKKRRTAEAARKDQELAELTGRFKHIVDENNIVDGGCGERWQVGYNNETRTVCLYRFHSQQFAPSDFIVLGRAAMEELTDAFSAAELRAVCTQTWLESAPVSLVVGS